MQPPSPSLPSLYWDTLRALAQPRRAVPIGLVLAAMVGAQSWFTPTPAAIVLSILLGASFVFVAPFSWRALFPMGRPVGAIPLRLLAYAALGGVPAAIAFVTDPVLARASYLLAGVNAAVVTVLFWTGGWGLGRDIELEQGLAAQRARAEAMAREAERAHLLAIRSHLDPHFLFNTLGAIAEWCREDGAVAEAAILRLSALLRRVMDGVQQDTWPLAKELDLVRDLWALHGVRDPERFTHQVSVSAGLEGARIPPLLLLPLVENAVKHGPAAGHSGPLRLQAKIEDGQVCILVGNPGPLGPERSGGEGLRMVRRRLALAYNETAKLHLATQSGRTQATIRMPRTPPELDP